MNFDYKTYQDGYVIYQGGQMITAYDLVDMLNNNSRQELMNLRRQVIQFLNSLDDMLGLERCVKTRKERRER